MTKVSDLMSSPPWSVTPQETLDHAARLLWEHDCGVLPVVDAKGSVGAAVTDRDICMAAYTTGRRLADLRVADCMSKQLVSCRAEDPVGTAAQTMQKHAVRRLPVLDKDGRLCGLLSLNDLAIKAQQDPALAKEVIKVLGAVCRHPATRPAPAVGTARTAEPTNGAQQQI
jgi:CBS domain-containing protein